MKIGHRVSVRVISEIFHPSVRKDAPNIVSDKVCRTSQRWGSSVVVGFPYPKKRRKRHFHYLAARFPHACYGLLILPSGGCIPQIKRFTGGRSKAGPCGSDARPGRLSESSEQSGDWAAECNWSTGLGVLFQSTVQLLAIGLD